jgi:hypothetical protein
MRVKGQAMRAHDMTDKADLLDLARRCRSLSAQFDDDATIRSLDRLADDFETRARIIDQLAECSRVLPARHARAAAHG